MAPTLITTMGWPHNTTSAFTSFSRLSAFSLRDALPTIPTVHKGGNWVIYGIILAIVAVIACLILGWFIRRRCFDKNIKKCVERAQQREETAAAFELRDYPAGTQRKDTWANMGARIEEVLQADKRAWEESGLNPYEERPRRKTFGNEILPPPGVIDPPRRGRQATEVLPPSGAIDPPRVKTPGVPTAAALAARSRRPSQRKSVPVNNGPPQPRLSKICQSADVATFSEAELRAHISFPQRKPVPVNNSQPRQPEIPQPPQSADAATFRQAERRNKVYANLKSTTPAKDAKPRR